MKVLIFVLMLFSFSSKAQTFYPDTSKTNCEFYSGVLTEKVFEGGTYIYAISSHYSYVEFTLPYMSESYIRYRVEIFSNDGVAMVTKQYSKNKEVSSLYFLAIDSGMAGQIKIKKGGGEKIYTDLSVQESFILKYITMHSAKYNLQNYFRSFNPDLFVGWINFKK